MSLIQVIKLGLRTIHRSLFSDKGFALITAIMVMVLLMALGSAAYMMTNLGYSAVTAEKRYQLSGWAAEYAVSSGITYVIDKAVCPPPSKIEPCIPLESGATCEYFSLQDDTGTFCTIYGKGQFGNAKVMKIATVPKTGSDWGGMVTRATTGQITLSGSSAIAGCDDDESSYINKCGMMPALISTLGTELTVSGNSELTEMCKQEGKIKGLFGNPPQYSTELPDDLTSRYFDASSWSDFLNRLETMYGVDLTPLPAEGTISIPSVSGTCRSEPDQFCCKTTSPTQISCYNDTGCTGATTKNIDLGACSDVKIDSLLTIGHSISGVNIFGDATGANYTISSPITGVNIKTKGKVTANAALTNTNITAVGDININNSTTNSTLVSGGTTSINLDSGTLMSNSNVFAANLSFNLKGASDRISGGTFYAQTGTIINATGGPRLGTVTNPVLLLPGDTAISVPGNLTINGLIFSNNTNISITGAVELQGSIINNGDSLDISNTGNGIIQFNKQVLDNLCDKFDVNPNNGICEAGGLMKKPKCGGGNKKDWVENTKMTLY